MPQSPSQSLGAESRRFPTPTGHEGGGGEETVGAHAPDMMATERMGTLRLSHITTTTTTTTFSLLAFTCVDGIAINYNIINTILITLK